MSLLRSLAASLALVLLVGAILVFTDVLPLEAYGAGVLWVGLFAVLLLVLVALAAGVRELLFRRPGMGRGGRLT